MYNKYIKLTIKIQITKEEEEENPDWVDLNHPRVKDLTPLEISCTLAARLNPKHPNKPCL
jgi:hypothetical protein